MLLHVFQGSCMALADSVPGVSGGTVAFILGFYEPFLNAVHSLFGKDSAARKAAFLYLLKLGVGWGAGLIGSVLLLARLFENNIYFLSSLFFGLTLTSIPCIVKAERRQILGRPQNCPFALLGLALVCGLTWFRAGSPGGTLDYTALGPLQYGCLFLSGALVISAMVLPGISGSSLLLIMEVYLPTVNAAHALLHLDFSVLPGVLVLGLGILAGAALSVRALRAALRKQRSRMLWLILGLMLGLLYRLVITNIDGFGDVGNGYYSAGFQIYTLLLALSSVGIPSAISKLVAQAEAAGNHRRSEDIFHTAMALFFGAGLVCAAALYLGADWIARYVIRMDGVQGTLRALSPAVLFVCLSSVLRGYYLGLGSARAAGSSQVVEQLLKSVLTVAIVLALTGYSAQAMSAGANLATSIAAGGGAAYLALYHIRAKRKAGRPTAYRKLSKRALFALSKTILRLSVPVSAASIIASVGSVIDTGTVSRGIAAAFADGIPGQAGIPSAQELSQEAVRLMGVLSKGDSILNLPLALNTAFMTIWCPRCRGCWPTGGKRRRALKSKNPCA